MQAAKLSRSVLSAINLAGLILTGVATSVFAQTDFWTAATDGKWEGAGNWSLGASPNTNQNTYITNAVTKTITIDATTISLLSSLPAISNLTLSTPVGATNTLYLNNPGTNQPLVILNRLLITNAGVWITNAAVQVSSTNCLDDGTIRMDDGLLTFPVTSVGNSAQGTITVNGGTVSMRTLALGVGSHLNGIANLTGGTLNLSSNLVVGLGTLSTGTVWMTGGQLTITNASSALGLNAVGLMTISNGTVIASTIVIGSNSNSRGTLTFNGGTVNATSLVVGGLLGATGSLWIANSQLNGNAPAVTIGGPRGGYGQLNITNATVMFGSLTIGLSNTPCPVAVLDSTVFITNAAANAVLDQRQGTFTFNGGTITVDSFLPSNTFLFVRGQLNTKHTSRIRSPAFTVGDGTNTATLELDGGIHAFTTGLNIASNSYLTGCGSLTGMVVNAGTILANCTSGTLTFYSTVTNNATLVATNGATVVFNGILVNNGLLDATAGVAIFGSIFINNGVILTNGAPGAYFSGTPRSGIAPMTVTFTDTSIGSLSNRYWDFGDGGTTNTSNTTMVYTYNNPGTNSVTLIVSGLAGSSTNTQSNYITVAAPAPLLSVSPAQINFGTLILGTVVTQDFTVVNAGQLTLTGSASVASPFAVTAGSSYSLTTGQTAQISVSFSPVATGSYSNQMAFTSNGGSASNLVFGSGIYNRTNIWTAGAGKWETGGNWSAGIMPTNNQTIFITNATNKAVTLDATTTTNAPTSMSVSNLLVFAPTGSTNTLYLSNPGTNQPFVVGNRLQIGTNGIFWVTNAAVQVTSVSGNNITIDGSLILDDGAVLATNTTTLLGGSGTGILSVNGGMFQGWQLLLGGAAQGNGFVQVTGGTMGILSNMTVGNISGSTGTVWISGGHLAVTNANLGTLTLGAAATASGTMTVSNGLVLARDIEVGQFGNGTITINGGGLSVPLNVVTSISITNTGGPVTNEFLVPGRMIIGVNANSTGSVFVTGGNLLVDAGTLIVGSSGRGTMEVSGGQVTATNGPTYIGANGVGWMSVSNATWLANDLYVSDFGTGTLTLVGSTNLISGKMFIGFGAGAGLGTVWLTGGLLATTNVYMYIGLTVPGMMTVSNATWLAEAVNVGGSSGGNGTLTIQSGTNTFNSTLNIGVGNGVYHPFAVVWLNGGQLTVTNASTTIGQYGTGRLSVSNGTCVLQNVYLGLQSAGVTVGIGTLTVAGGTFIANSVILGTNDSPNGLVAHGFFNVTGGKVVIGSQGNGTSISIGDQAGCTGNISVAGGQFINTNSATIIGNYGIGSLNLSNGTMNTSLTQIGEGESSQGALTIASNSTLNVASNLTAGQASGATGTVTMTGGSLVVTNGVIGIGNDGTATNGVGVGSMTVTNSTVMASQILLGSSAGGQGDLIIQSDGVVSFDNAGSNTSLIANDLVLAGGTLSMTNGTLFSGNSHPGAIVISNGLARCLNLVVGLDNPGTFSQAGGQLTVLAGATVGDCGLGVAGQVSLSGGSLFVTNANGNAVLDVRDGVVTLAGGSLRVDTIVMTNACGLLHITGGTLHYGTAILDPNLSALGDGIPNGWKLAHGFNALDPAVAGQDPDGDGFSNLQEYLAGSDPTNGASTFSILSVTPINSDLLIVWTAFSGHTNVVEAAGNLTSAYTNVSPNIIITSSGTTNYLDAGAVTNSAARYYRIRLVP